MKSNPVLPALIGLTALAAAVVACACLASAASSAPAPRLARALPAERAAAANARARHNEALLGLLSQMGLPAGQDLSNVVARTEAMAAISAACTNSAGNGIPDAPLFRAAARQPSLRSTNAADNARGRR